MQLRVPDKKVVEWVRRWRNEDISCMRTPYQIAEEMQQNFYQDVICNRDSRHRYWAVWEGDDCIAFGGLTNIQWENRIAEISLIVNPNHTGKGVGRNATHLLLKEGFGNMNLQTIFGECYMCSKSIGFWRRMVGEIKGYMTSLPRHKYWQGEYYDSLYFSFDRKCLCNLKK